MQHKIYIDRSRIEKQMEELVKSGEDEAQSSENIKLFSYKPGEYWKPQWDIISTYKIVLQSASRLKVKSHTFYYETKKIPRPKEVYVTGSWDNWTVKTRLNL